MNVDYLLDTIIPERLDEIKKGENLMTRQPIYVVLDMQANYITGHTEFTPSTNLRGWYWEKGYIDQSLDAEDRHFNKSKEKMFKPCKVTRFYTDTFKAFFLTSRAAHDYLKYQAHNLTDGYVYVFYSGYGNRQMDAFLNNS